MTNAVHDLVELLQVEQLELNLFRGVSADIGSPRVFGGQVLGQALMAAALTVQGRTVHSLHAYFLRPGDKRSRIVYDVERIRDGGSFTTRRVVAIQHGQPIFNMAASFQLREDGVEHQTTMPDVPAPEGLASESELRRQSAHRMPSQLHEIFQRGLPIDIRPLHPTDLLEPSVRVPRSDAWFRVADRLPDDPMLHQAMLAYASDFNLLRTSMLPHGLSFFQHNVQSASLDHAMWIHREFRIDDWLLYVTDSPSASNARGFCRGTIYTREGRLVASVAQEGLVRVRASREAAAGT